MITLEKVNKRFRMNGTVIHALVDVNLHVAKGDFVSVTGPSGSGKTTLLLTMGGLDKPDSGKICIRDESVYDIGIGERARIRCTTLGFLFQTFNLIPYLTALENVQIPLYLAGKSKEEQLRRSTELLERVGLGDRIYHKPSKLSVGQQQRVALARTLANSPQIILADEPTGNLDPDMTRELMDYLKKLNVEDSVTIVMVTHNHGIAGEASRHMRLVGGKIEEIEAPLNPQETSCK